jgi:hypothetical protein
MNNPKIGLIVTSALALIFGILGIIIGYMQRKVSKTSISISGMILSAIGILYVAAIFIIIPTWVNITTPPIRAYIAPCTVYKQIGIYDTELTDENMISLAQEYYESIGYKISKEKLKVIRLSSDILVTPPYDLESNWSMICDSHEHLIHNSSCSRLKYGTDTIDCDEYTDCCIDRSICLGSLKFENNKVFKSFSNPC